MGMRNPYNSWQKSDSIQHELTDSLFALNLDEPITTKIDPFLTMGKEDRRLAAMLIHNGEPHCKFLRQIPVTMNITAPLYWWKQMDTYKVGTTTNSTSTMHMIMSAPLNREDFSFDDCYYFAMCLQMADDILVNLNTLIWKHNHSNDPMEKEHLFNAVVQLLPESYNQMRTWSGNYSVLRNIYAQRNHHKLREWREFCGLLKNLPLSWMIDVGLEGGVTYADIANG